MTPRDPQRGLVQHVIVRWRHELADEPIAYFSELGPDRFEIRKVQIHRDGRMQWADATRESDVAGLSEIAFPPLAQIAADPQFDAEQIEADRFEEIWRQAVTHGGHPSEERGIEEPPAR